MELPDRDKREAAFAAELAKVMSRHRAELKELLGDPPNPDNVPQEFWDRVERETRGEMVMPMFVAWMDAAVLHGMERDLAMRQAQEYAIGKSFQVSRQMTETGKRYVRDAFSRAQADRDAEIAKHDAETKTLIDQALADGEQAKADKFRQEAELKLPAGDLLTKGDVIDLTTKVFGPKRAAGAAENETVRAQNSGIKGFVMSSPKRLVAYWRHSELREPGHSGADINPCDICTPMEGKPWTEWGGLFPGEAHPSCDCTLSILDPEAGQFIGPDPDPEGLDDWAEEFGIPNAPSPVGSLRVNESLDYGAHLRMLQEAARDPELRASIRDAASTTDRNPTEGQSKAGNYAKGKFRLHGFTVSIENPRGSIRWGKRADGTEWSQCVPHHYGYLNKTEGADGDHVDVWIGPDPESELIFVVDQRKPDSTFDEHKCLIGFHNEAEARQAYLDGYPAGWNGLAAITAMTLPEFREWLHGDTSVPTALAESVLIGPRELEELLLEFSEDQPRVPAGEPGGGQFTSGGGGVGIAAAPKGQDRVAAAKRAWEKMRGIEAKFKAQADQHGLNWNRVKKAKQQLALADIHKAHGNESRWQMAIDQERGLRPAPATPADQHTMNTDRIASVLQKAARPLGPREIHAAAEGHAKGNWAGVRNVIQADIAQHGEQSRFVKTTDGKYELRGRVGAQELAPREQSTDKGPLRSSKVSSVERMKSTGNINDTYAVELQDGTKGIFKPEKGMTAAGRQAMKGLFAEREAAASDVADALGLRHLVPPTVVREVTIQHVGDAPTKERGSFQKFVENADDAAHTTASRRFDGDKDERLGGAFDYLIGHSDRHIGNWMIDDHDRLHLIDNGLAFPSSHDMPMCNAFMLAHLEQRGARVPEEVKQWPKHWGEIEGALKSHGFDSDTISLTKERMNALAKNAGEKFSRLRDFGPHGWNMRFKKGYTSGVLPMITTTGNTEQ